MLGALTSSAQVGLYNVATRLVTQATFILPAINMAFAPRIADLHHRRQEASLRRAYAVATSWNVRLTVPLFVAMVAFPKDLLALFGKSFTVAVAVTVILAAGKFVNAATGPCGLMLDMSGRPKWTMVDNVTVLVLNVVLNLWWIPRYGIVGSAAAWAISLALVNVARVVQVWRLLGMLPFDLGVLKGLVAGVGALLVGLLVAWLLAPPLELVVGLAALAASYVAFLALLGITPEDRLVLQSLAGRFGLRRGRHLARRAG
jgi:O-antigen/teichoic acid export membrane protein